MISWIADNIGTIVVLLVLVLIVAAVVRSMIRDKRCGKSSCGGNCAHCNLCAAGHSAGTAYQKSKTKKAGRA